MDTDTTTTPAAASGAGRWWRVVPVLVLSGLLVCLAVVALAQPRPPAGDCSGPGPHPVPCAPTPPPGPQVICPTGPVSGGRLVCRTVPNSTGTPATPPASTPSSAPSPSAAPSVSSSPRPSSPPPVMPTTTTPSTGGGLGWLASAVTDAITGAISGLLSGIITATLAPLLKLLAATLLTTPPLADLPRMVELWLGSRAIAVGVYALLVLAGGLIVLSRESLHTRYGFADIAPRLVWGFAAAMLSRLVIGKVIELANALSWAALGVSSVDASTALSQLVTGALSNPGSLLFLPVIAVVIVVMLVIVLLTFIVRVALTVILVAAAPVMLACHALPQSEGIAKWWWRAFTGLLAVQVAQSLALACTMRIFITPGGLSLFGVVDGLVNLLVVVALLYILIKIPFWVLASLRGQQRSFVGGLARAYVAGRAFGVLGGRTRPRRARPPKPPGGGGVGVPWPAPLSQWGGLGGIYSPQATAHRLRNQVPHVSGAAHGLNAALFQQPGKPTHFRPTGPFGSTAMPPFSSTRAPGAWTPQLRAWASPPRFQEAQAASSGPTMRTATVPPHLRFQAATPEHETPPPTRATGSAAPPVFDTGTPVRPTTRARVERPSPPAFHTGRPEGGGGR
ncbi:hypothetical protein NLX83_15770 [Allokutzneria sp. A3M-2-11 16]|uniref:hypothetical protein n=1 Tax=Allokutzneria sp. A3M-2-11 16 TaxID=2962043 RepID=UPI0020B69FCE|nr:hypothetical protein [Allokutzneria sp. A3M-2-11 16]MCP3800726.1 hypothetical protein [Allokutzneria sp. A3M-2-11 16]